MQVNRHRLDQRLDPSGRPYFWIGGHAPSGIVENGADFGALAEGYVSISHLKLNLTVYHPLEVLSD
jgi:5'/3'-nucleotidase